MIGLLIVGHGSNLPYYREVLEVHKKRIEEMGLFNEVEVALLMENPRIDDVIRRMKSDKIFVVPLFISHGRHTMDMRRSLGAGNGIAKVYGKEVYLCDPIGRDVLVTYAIILSALRANILNLKSKE